MVFPLPGKSFHLSPSHPRLSEWINKWLHGWMDGWKMNEATNKYNLRSTRKNCHLKAASGRAQKVKLKHCCLVLATSWSTSVLWLSAMRCIANSLSGHYDSDTREMKQTISFVFNIMGRLMVFIQHYSHSLAFFEWKRGKLYLGCRWLCIMLNALTELSIYKNEWFPK